MNLAIVGSRDFKDEEIFNELVESLLEETGKPELIISGGATGADTFAEKYAKKNDIPTKIFLPDWHTFGKSAGPMRNKEIVNLANFMIAFRTTPDSIGTNNSIGLAIKKKIPIRIIDVKKDGYTMTKVT